MSAVQRYQLLAPALARVEVEAEAVHVLPVRLLMGSSMLEQHRLA